MIYFLSDQHGGEQIGQLPEYMESATEEDLLISLGDVGLRFQDTQENREFDRYFLSAHKNIAFLDGNHENFPYYNSFPVEQWCGGSVHRLTDKIVHLMRGNVYDIQGKRIFVFGGCRSSAKWKEMGLWRPEEAPTEEELALAYRNLEKCGYRVDYVLTHKYETSDGTPELRKLCEFIEQNVTYTHWYAGHWHKQMRPDDQHTFVYDVLIPMED